MKKVSTNLPTQYECTVSDENENWPTLDEDALSYIIEGDVIEVFNKSSGSKLKGVVYKNDRIGLYCNCEHRKGDGYSFTSFILRRCILCNGNFSFRFVPKDEHGPIEKYKNGFDFVENHEIKNKKKF